MPKAAAVLDAPRVETPLSRVQTRKKRGNSVVVEFDYDRSKIAFQREEDFWSFLSGYPDKSGVSVYLYRLWPAIDFGLIGRDDSYVEVLADPERWSHDYVETTYGGGEYMLKLSDGNQKPSERARTWIRIIDPDLEPKLDLRSLKLNEPKNADYIERLIARGRLVRGEDSRPRLPRPDGAPVANNGTVSVVPPVIYQASVPSSAPDSLSSDLLKMVLANAFKSPQEQLNFAVKFAEMSRPDAEPVREIRPVRQRSMLEQLTEFAEARKSLESLFPAPVQVDAGGGWSGFLTSLIPVLPSLGQQIAVAIATVRRSSAPAALPPGAPVPVYPGGAPVGVYPGGSVTEVPAPAPYFAAGASPGVSPGSGVPGGGAAVSAEVLLMHGALAPEVRAILLPADILRLQALYPVALEKWRRGVPGLDFAVWVSVQEGADFYSRLDRAIGPEGLMQAILTFADPQTQQALQNPATRAHLDNWIDGFFSLEYDGRPGDESDGDGDGDGSEGADAK